jgi:hypothetical protein
VTPFDRQVRAQVYRHIVASGLGPTSEQLAGSRGWSKDEVEEALRRLQAEHLVAVSGGGAEVIMAHPFSGRETSYVCTVGERSWFANCAWDALAILALMGDGQATITRDEDDLIWTVEDGQVSPDGVIHLKVPARDFWEDIAFT